MEMSGSGVTILMGNIQQQNKQILSDQFRVPNVFSVEEAGMKLHSYAGVRTATIAQKNTDVIILGSELSPPDKNAVHVFFIGLQFRLKDIKK